MSSARAHLEKSDDDLAKVDPLLNMVPDWKSFLHLSSDDELDLLHRHERTGRPLGNNNFIETLEQALNRILRPQKPGPKKKQDSN